MTDDKTTTRESSLDFLEYPCDFPLKVVGKTSAHFETVITKLIRLHVNESHDIAIKQNPSKKNTYVSLTVTFKAQSREQLETIYQCLYDCPDVMMTL